MSKQCVNCGNILDDNSKFCDKCGANQQYAQNDYYQQQYTQNMPYYQPVAQTSLGGWIGWVALCVFLPIIGALIAMFCSEDTGVKNFGKAMLIISAVEIVLAILLIAVFGSIIAGLLLYSL